MRRDIEFNRLLARTIDNSLREVLSEKATSVIYEYLKSSYALDQEDIPQRLGLFIDGLHEFLSTGAYAVEHAILENLHSNLKCTDKLALENENNFEDAIVHLKNCLKLR